MKKLLAETRQTLGLENNYFYDEICLLLFLLIILCCRPSNLGLDRKYFVINRLTVTVINFSLYAFEAKVMVTFLGVSNCNIFMKKITICLLLHFVLYQDEVYR
jgi:hypothetical protein